MAIKCDYIGDDGIKIKNAIGVIREFEGSGGGVRAPLYLYANIAAFKSRKHFRTIAIELMDFKKAGDNVHKQLYVRAMMDPRISNAKRF